jgi:hypothetical protein
LPGGRPKSDDATATPTESQDDGLGASASFKLIRTYGAAAASEPLVDQAAVTSEPVSSDSLADAEPAGATDVAEEAPPEPVETPRPPVDTRDSRPSRGALEDAATLTDVLNARIVEARHPHHAVALVAARLESTTAEHGVGPSEVAQKVERLLRDLAGSVGENELFFDRDKQLLWLILPGVLPRRAHEITRMLRALMDRGGIGPDALAVAGYPRDAATAAELLAQVEAAIETAK